MEIRDPNCIYDHDLVVGSVVSLRSGGPDMTISDVVDDRVTCIWFGKSDRAQTKTFSRGMLQPGSSRSVIILPPCAECDAYAPIDVQHRVYEQGQAN